MKISYGPPGASGVSSLQYVSGLDDFVSSSIHQLTGPVVLASLGVFGYAAMTGRRRLRNASAAVSGASILIHLLTRTR